MGVHCFVVRDQGMEPESSILHAFGSKNFMFYTIIRSFYFWLEEKKNPSIKTLK